MVSQPFEESAENRKALEKLVRERRKSIQVVMDKLEGLRRPRSLPLKRRPK
jgi:hypothetical protein